MADSNARIARREKVPIPVQDYYSVDEVAALLRISRNRVYDLAKEREDTVVILGVYTNFRDTTDATGAHGRDESFENE